jgi:uncharacterized protein YqjF (DUF2071 family)
VNAPALLAMSWRDALFLHWPLDASALRPSIPPALSIDLYEGMAWIGIVAFRIEDVRPRGLPAACGVATFGEINVRTYVRGSRPGVWFFSLDADHGAAVTFARATIGLPYHRAHVDVRAERDRRAVYFCERREEHAPAAHFTAAARFAPEERHAAPGTLEHFLIERYSLYAARGKRILRGDVVHTPWPLHTASALIGANTLLTANGLPQPDVPPLVHASPGVAVLARVPVAERR